jgi:hypothetical protein
LTRLLVVGAGLFGSQAAAYARTKGIEAQVYDPGLAGGASLAAAGLFCERWVGNKMKAHFHRALPILDHLFGIRQVQLEHDDGAVEKLLWVPPRLILEAHPIRQTVTSVGDGWLETESGRHEGWVYIAAGVWCDRFLPDMRITGKAGTSLVFPGESRGRVRALARGRQAIAFAREPVSTFFSDGTAEENYTPEHERLTCARAAAFGLTTPSQRLHGVRPYTRGGPVFTKLGERTWLATGGRKMGTILGASFARQLVDECLS